MSPLPLSGEQYEIRAGAYAAVAVGLGGAIRTLSAGGRPLLDPFDADALPDGGRGQVLAPWPNRLGDGCWSWRGRALQLPITEVAKHNAVHGLVRWGRWEVRDHEDDRVVLGHRLEPLPGYPFRLDLQSTYSLGSSDGLTVDLRATNAGSEPAPVALGTHPYLAAPGGGLVDDCRLTVPAGSQVLVDDRGLPTGTRLVDGTDHDFRRSRPIGGQHVDSALGDLAADADGRVRVLLTDAGGDTTELWTEAPARWLQVYTGDTLAPERRRRGLAVEPTTAPPAALATGEDLAVLEPGRSLTLRWGVRAR